MSDLVGRLVSEAQTILNRHVKKAMFGSALEGGRFDYCDTCCGHPQWPCPDYEAAVRVLGIAKEIAERDEKVREIAEEILTRHADLPDPAACLCDTCSDADAILDVLAERYPEEGAS